MEFVRDKKAFVVGYNVGLNGFTMALKLAQDKLIGRLVPAGSPCDQARKSSHR